MRSGRAAHGGGGFRGAPLTARLAVAGALPADEVPRAEACLAALGVPLAGKGAEDGAAEGGAVVTVMGSWSLAEARALIASGGGAVRGVGLLEYCTEHAERRDLLTRTETPCMLNRTLRDELVCFSGIEGGEKAALVFKVEVMAASSPVCCSAGCPSDPAAFVEPDVAAESSACTPEPDDERVRGRQLRIGRTTPLHARWMCSSQRCFSRFLLAHAGRKESETLD